MRDPQLRSFITGCRNASDWFQTPFFSGREFKGDMLAANTFELAMNAMRWLTKHFYPEFCEGFSKLYRIHALDSYPEVGATVKVKPHKPILSWTDLEKVVVDDRSAWQGAGRVDAVLSITPPVSAIIFSYKSKAVIEEIDAVIKPLSAVPVFKRSTKDKLVLDALDAVFAMCKAPSKHEREVVVHLPGEFKAKVESLST